MDQQIIKTLSYFDIFDYPLTFLELKKYLGEKIEYTDDELLDLIDTISIVQEANGYYYLLGRQRITEKRMERAGLSIEKFGKARVVGKILSYIPTVQYIGVSGSLSMNNASVSDDIDFFIITKKDLLWTTRALVTVVLILIGQKRPRGSQEAKDKICPNMFLAEDKLSFLQKSRTLYTAHEIFQLRPIFDRCEMQGTLLMKNKWITNFLPNMAPIQAKQKKKSLFDKVITTLLQPFETVSYILQKAYMKSHRSIETITKGKAFFHPLDRQAIILDMFKLRFKRYKKLYSDNLWVDGDEARFYMEEKKIRILN